jgi:hypothetical protein
MSTSAHGRARVDNEYENHADCARDVALFGFTKRGVTTFPALHTEVNGTPPSLLLLFDAHITAPKKHARNDASMLLSCVVNVVFVTLGKDALARWMPRICR